MTESIKRPVAFISGSSSGIGQGLAIGFSQAGYDVILHYHLNEIGVLETQKLCQKNLVQTQITQCDLRDFDAVKVMIEEIHALYGSIEVLICNAGIVQDQRLLLMDEKSFDDVMTVNVKACFNLLKPVARGMVKKRKGCIIAISSIVGQTGNIGQINYAASKAAIIAMMKTAALELAPYQIRCNSIVPGFIDAGMSVNLNEKIKKQWIEKTALKRVGTVEDVLSVALFLANDQANYITGQTINVDGGLVMGG